MENDQNIRVAVVGCLHGALSSIIKEIQQIDKEEGKKTDLLICCGDFQAVRDENDLSHLACPPKYRKMGEYCLFDSKKEIAPFLVVFVGGNHEPSNYLEENYYGGWMTENIFYLGRCGIIQYKGIRIAGFSGIFNKQSYQRGHFERDIKKNIHTVYHQREFDLARMNLVEEPIDIFVTHDWPTAIVSPSEKKDLITKRHHFKNDLMADCLGSPANRYLFSRLKPKVFI